MQQLFELAPQFQISWFYWILALLAAMIVGLSKSGIKGLVIIVVTIMAFIYDGKASTGIILPLLMVGVFKLPFHIFVWETITVETLAVNVRLIPAILLGIVVGIQILKYIKDDTYRKMVLVVTAVGAVLIFFR